MKIHTALTFLAALAATHARLVARVLPADGPADDGTCEFEEEMVTYKLGKKCCPQGFDVTFGIDNESDPKMGSHFPFGFIHMASWQTKHKEETLQCMYSKGYSTNQKDMGDGTVLMTFNGHLGFIAAEKDAKLVTIAPGVDFPTPPCMVWFNGGEFAFTVDIEDCEYDAEVAVWTCDGPQTIVKANGNYVDLCAAMTLEE